MKPRLAVTGMMTVTPDWVNTGC